MAVVVTVAKGYDLAYIWKAQAEPGVWRTAGGYYLNAAQAGEPPGRWWGPGAQALGFSLGQTVERTSYEAVYRQIDPRTGSQLGRPRGRYATFAEHLARLRAAEPHATAERLIELERLAAQATRQPAAYTDGDQHRARRQETLAGSYQALRDLYRQREQSLAQSMADRQDWEHATAPARHLAVAADAELRSRHPDQQIHPLRSAEPVPPPAPDATASSPKRAPGPPTSPRSTRHSARLSTSTGT